MVLAQRRRNRKVAYAGYYVSAPAIGEKHVERRTIFPVPDSTDAQHGSRLNRGQWVSSARSVSSPDEYGNWGIYGHRVLAILMGIIRRHRENDGAYEYAKADNSKNQFHEIAFATIFSSLAGISRLPTDALLRSLAQSVLCECGAVPCGTRSRVGLRSHHSRGGLIRFRRCATGYLDELISSRRGWEGRYCAA